MHMNPADDMARVLSGGKQPMNALFGVPHQQLQHMAGQVVYPPASRFTPAYDTDQYWNNVSAPAGVKAIQNMSPQPPNVLPIRPGLMGPAGR